MSNKYVIMEEVLKKYRDAYCEYMAKSADLKLDELATMENDLDILRDNLEIIADLLNAFNSDNIEAFWQICEESEFYTIEGCNRNFFKETIIQSLTN